MNVPDVFKRKMLADHFIEKEASKEVVSFSDFKKLKQMQQELRRMCASYGKTARK